MNTEVSASGSTDGDKPDQHTDDDADSSEPDCDDNSDDGDDSEPAGVNHVVEEPANDGGQDDSDPNDAESDSSDEDEEAELEQRPQVVPVHQEEEIVLPSQSRMPLPNRVAVCGRGNAQLPRPAGGRAGAQQPQQISVRGEQQVCGRASASVWRSGQDCRRV